jgi:hypothetical protein
MLSFFVAEAKATSVSLDVHLPQLLLELVGCAKSLQYVTFCASPIPLTFCA